MLQNENELFKCQICEEEGEDMRKQLKTINTELKKLEKLEKIDQLMDSINFMSAKFDEVFKDVQQNKKKINEIKNENKKLKIEVKNLKDSVKFLNGERVKNDCIISGLEVSVGVKPIDAVIDLSNKLGVKIEPNAVKDVYIMKPKNQANENKTVVVKFFSKIKKDELMSAKNKLKDGESTRKIYVNDFHSKETLNLFFHAKSLKTIGYKHVYVRNEQVFCKKSDISRQQIIRCEDDVDAMLLNATTNKHWERRSMVLNRADEVDDNTEDGEEDADYVSP